jgi:antitoxin HigA-1
MTRSNPLIADLAPRHPGELLRDVALPALSGNKTEIASLLGVSRQTLDDISPAAG